MKKECVTCILNQITRVTEYLDLNNDLSERIFKRTLSKSDELDYFSFLPPLYSEIIYKELTDETGIPDPYKKLRKEQNDLILNNINGFRSKIRSSDDPLFTSLYYSLLGNIIDYGGVRIFDIDEIFSETEEQYLTVNDYVKFRNRLETAGTLLVISDNAGEAVFDMLFLEQIRKFYPDMKIWYGVRSGPAINDIIIEDAIYIGIDKYAEIIETGSTYAGTVIPISTPEFISVYNKSDIIISKGQGNFETLEGEDNKNIFFIFKVKCDVVSGFTGLKTGSLVLGYRNSLTGKL
ncbi:MAG: ARMT1-like domain-containing protein [Acidobacteriota bacterium]